MLKQGRIPKLVLLDRWKDLLGSKERPQPKGASRVAPCCSFIQGSIVETQSVNASPTSAFQPPQLGIGQDQPRRSQLRKPRPVPWTSQAAMESLLLTSERDQGAHSQTRKSGTEQEQNKGRYVIDRVLWKHRGGAWSPAELGGRYQGRLPGRGDIQVES